MLILAQQIFSFQVALKDSAVLSFQSGFNVLFYTSMRWNALKVYRNTSYVILLLLVLFETGDCPTTTKRRSPSKYRRSIGHNV